MCAVPLFTNHSISENLVRSVASVSQLILPPLYPRDHGHRPNSLVHGSVSHCVHFKRQVVQFDPGSAGCSLGVAERKAES